MLKKTTFYLVRHGQTLFNQRKWIQGWTDSPLTEQGIQTAKRLYQPLQNIPFIVCVSSTSERAVDTAYCMVSDRMEVHTYKGLKEINFGRIEAMPIATAFEGKDHRLGYTEWGGERKIDAVKRYLDTLEQIACQYGPGEILVSSHGTIIRELIAHIDPNFDAYVKPLAELVPNCSITKIGYENGRWSVEGYPDTSYLE
ncbi:MAG: histidine phosphatase family protein [Erysipelotrichaceae bacterium]|nr:histidine phosphatase family protein [Erysipelotrichaceae bacterium]